VPCADHASDRAMLATMGLRPRALAPSPEPSPAPA
jgi:hypothetical protein